MSMPPELLAAAQKLGIDPAMLAGGGDDSPPVWVGSTTTRRRVRTGDPNARFQDLEDVKDKVRSSADVYMNFWKWDDEKLLDFQERAFKAGLYGTDQRDRVRWKDRDADTERIWKDMVDRSAAFYAVDRKVTPWDALDEAARAGAGFEADKSNLPDRATNPADLRALAKSRGKEKLGRDLTVEEQARVAGKLSAAEQPFLSADATVAAPGQAALTEAADQEVKRIAPDRYDARRVVGVFDTLARALGGGG